MTSSPLPSLALVARAARRERTRVTTREAAITREPDSIEIGPPKLTRFEKARVVGARALQISMGAPVLLDLKQDRLSPIDVALMELEEGVLPISIRRSLPDGTSQNIPLKWLLHPVEEKKPRSKKEDEYPFSHPKSRSS